MATTVIQHNDPQAVVSRLSPYLSRSEDDERPVVLMTCGIAGAGKTTLSKEVLRTHPNFQRLSIDEIIASRHGIYNIDYDPSQHEAYSEEAVDEFQVTLQRLLAGRQVDIVLDRAFYAKEDRDDFKALIEKSNARWVLVHLKVDESILWRRIGERRKKGVDANCALEISEDLFRMYVDGFEHPCGEGEIVVEYTE
ncbi:hypothetical protein M409DRAFT_17925 [Zasmidium cellare ATCC 36951]|uniref:Zeta toxin domain-containing protein n=1 Tax=Zasmidium cellare ATCC 36951 TaxID=1080233 RepID=A0A6A6CZU8_ZASCE|nr:uncharacterized protein M409DRAFT_17925 [Zasmidium cellare ATCC 36951]KAF2171688.1 hypothetical protein M409DRAFT_17925 [Zasmidium cellare ATCC 36951]